MTVVSATERFTPGRRPARAHVFAVLTVDRGAHTCWLARTLNAHPEIFCLAAWNKRWRELEPPVIVEGVAYAALILRATNSSYAAAGDVGGFSPADLEPLAEVFGDGFSPVLVTRSPAATLADRASGPVDAAAAALNGVARVPTEVPAFRFEDVTTRSDALVELVRVVSGDRVRPDDAWVDEVLADPAAATPSETMVDEKHAAELAAVLTPEARDAYLRLGYPGVRGRVT